MALFRSRDAEEVADEILEKIRERIREQNNKKKPDEKKPNALTVLRELETEVDQIRIEARAGVP